MLSSRVWLTCEWEVLRRHLPLEVAAQDDGFKKNMSRSTPEIGVITPLHLTERG
jgi:hypothetical protein